MKILLSILAISISVVFISCKKNQDNSATPISTSTADGKWKYDKNINGFCGEDMFGEVMEIKNGAATILSIPNNGWGWKAGQQTLGSIAQTSSPSSFTGRGYSQGAGGTVVNPSITVKLTVATNVSSMTVDYGNTVCNPVQLWSKTN